MMDSDKEALNRGLELIKAKKEGTNSPNFV